MCVLEVEIDRVLNTTRVFSQRKRKEEDEYNTQRVLRENADFGKFSVREAKIDYCAVSNNDRNLIIGKVY